ncbi:uncharacterized protein K452DRAFT_235346, partial [Aplosporella prunicola CBS 121167]
MTSGYVHEPLPEGKYIRLLELLPSDKHDDMVECNLSSFSLSLAPQYEALSYTWSATFPQFQMRCNGKGYSVRAQLYNALKRLRRKTQEGFLWIDAICINQASEVEKNHQVPLIRGIFERAQVVLIWLGEEADDSNMAINFLKALQLLIWVAVRKFLQRPWFSRIWILQEVAVAKRATI